MNRSARAEKSESKTPGRQHRHPGGNNPSPVYLPPRLALQSRLGNQAVQRLLHARLLQPKLTVSHPSDLYEQEADRVADAVLRMPDPAPSVTGVSPPAVQRLCSSCRENPQRRAPEEELRRLATDDNGPGIASSEVEDSIHALAGRGSVLPESVRAFMEPRFGYDFGAVRIHTDAHAAELARSVNAQAFTVGRDIVFGSGHYLPDAERGKRLLAHELTHVVQQESPGQVLHRFYSCETVEQCPSRDPGEARRSSSTPQRVEEFPSPTFGILIADFAVNEHLPKSDLHSNLTWINLLAHIGLAASDEWEILGFTDCEGTESRNAVLRQDRADEVATLLPSSVRRRVRTVSAAALGDCIASNATESGRSRNRSVLVRRLAGSRGPTAPPWHTPIGPVRPAGSPADFCVPYTIGLEASAARLWLETAWLTFASHQFGTDVHDLWRDYLNRPKGSSLTPRVFRGAGHPIVDAFRTDPETVRHQGLVYADIVAAAARTPEATIPLTGAAYTSPPIPLGTLLPAASLIRTINYTDPHARIPGNIAGGTGVMGTGSSDAGPDLRLFTGSVRISRARPSPGSPEVRSALIDLQLQVIDCVDFCPGAAGGFWAQQFTIPMSRLEATTTERTYDLPFHVFVDLSGAAPIP